MSGITRAPRLRLACALFLSSASGALRLLAALCLVSLLGSPLLAQQQYVVQRGDTLFALAARYGTTVEELRRENGLDGSLLRVGQLLDLPGGAAGFRFESARAGETLEQLASRVGLSLRALSLANPALDGQLTVGTSVRIPPGEGVSLRLEEGDSALVLAMRYGVAPSELLVTNGLDHLGAVRAGDWLYLPVSPLSFGMRGAASGEPARPAEATGALGRDWHARQQQRLLTRAPLLLADFVPASSVFVMPLEGRLSSSYGWRNISVAGNRFHGGIDLAVDQGTPVVAAMDGVVVRAGWVGAYGYAVYLDHGDGLQTRYAHLSALLVEEGARVRQGDVIARAGSTGASTGPHLHFEIRIEGQAVDPLTLLER